MTTTMPKARQKWATPKAASHTATVHTTREQQKRSTSLHPNHRMAIQDRAHRRRIPWIAATATVGTSALSWGMTALFSSTTIVGATPVAAGVAALPVAIGFVAAWRCREHPRWLPDIAGGVLAAAGLTFWTGMTGPSWWQALALLLATVACSARWWRANPVGPGVAPVWQPPHQPESEPTPQEAEPVLADQPPEVDTYAELWDRNIGAPGRAFPGSRLTNRVVDDATTKYEVELDSGKHTYEDLQRSATSVAGGLRTDRDNIIIEPPVKGGGGASTARLTIVTHTPISQPRLFAGPKWNNGVVEGLARFSDGSGEVALTIFDKQGSKRMMFVGDSGGGKSAAANCVTTGVMSSGLFNLMYIDPKGNSSAAMKNAARVAIIGKSNALQAHLVMNALIQARADWSMHHGRDLLLPSEEFPGIFTLHDEIGLVAKETAWVNVWAEVMNIQRSLGLPIAGMNQVLHETWWGGDRIRTPFAQQAVVFRISSKSDDLIPGLNYRPNELPVDERGLTIPGIAVHAGLGRPGVPALWDWLPTDDDPLEFDPPYRTSTAFSQFFDPPELHPVDVKAIESVLGPAVNGRWVVGPGGTHTFSKKQQQQSQALQGTRKARGAFGAAKPDTDETCKDAVFSLVSGGTTARAAIVKALPQFKEGTVDKSLADLTADGLLVNTTRGVYEAATHDNG